MHLFIFVTLLISSSSSSSSSIMSLEEFGLLLFTALPSYLLTSCRRRCWIGYLAAETRFWSSVSQSVIDGGRNGNGAGFFSEFDRFSPVSHIPPIPW